jgi:3-phosphoshikimate 1-carboxyvinyltransferase
MFSRRANCHDWLPCVKSKSAAIGDSLPPAAGPFRHPHRLANGAVDSRHVKGRRLAAMTRMVSRPAAALTGVTKVPGDKSISHRAVIVGACATGETRIRGLLEAEDVLATIAAVRSLGADAERSGDGWRICGRGVGGLVEPARVLDFGNSGTAARLVAGVAASHPFVTFLCGDSSLSNRPMQRIIEPLERMGAAFWSRSGGRLPLAVRGAADPLAITYVLPVASAQVKSAVLLAGLNAAGTTTIVEPQPTRDHSERMLRHFGARLEIDGLAGGGRRVSLCGQPELTGREVAVPGDFSSAAFPLIAALTIGGSRVVLRDVGVNPLRTGLLATLTEMGAKITCTPAASTSLEPVADLVVEAGPLRAVDVPAERVPSMIDEFPVFAVAAACAAGTTRIAGLAELRVKESDRLEAIARGLDACGVVVDAGRDWLHISGTGAPPPGGAAIAVNLDHRIAMAFLVLGSVSRQPVRIDDGSSIATSFPEFVHLMNGLGTAIEAEECR